MTAQGDRRYVKPGELLAFRSDFFQQDDRGAFFWLFGPSVCANERIGSAMVVRIEGPLEYHSDCWGESYESIVERTQWALAGKVDGDSDADDCGGPPKCVIYRMNSPGGVVSGLDQTISKLRSMSVAAGIPIYTYVDETAYSAGFALSCATSQIYLPRSGFLGSIGVISTMVDVTGADRKAGYRFVVLTSGARKADGHPHVAITEDMIAEERPRVQTLANQFYQVVKQARFPRQKGAIAKIQSWEAKRFLGAEAERAGLADDVMSWDDFLGFVEEKHTEATGSAYSVPSAKGDETDRKAKLALPGTLVAHSTAGEDMTVRLDALIARSEAALKSATDPAEKARIGAELEAARKTKKMLKKSEEEEEEATGSEEEEEAKSRAAALAASNAARQTDDDEDDEDDEDDDEDDEDEKKSKKAASDEIVRAAGLPTKDARMSLRRAISAALSVYGKRETKATKVLAAARQLTGKKNTAKVIDALRGQFQGSASLKSQVGSIRTELDEGKKTNAIDAALNAARITPAEAKTLRSESLTFVQKFLGMRPNAIVQPSTGPDGQPLIVSAGGGSSPEAQAAIDGFIAAAQRAGAKVSKEDVTKKLAERATNGAGAGRVI